MTSTVTVRKSDLDVPQAEREPVLGQRLRRLRRLVPQGYGKPVTVGVVVPQTIPWRGRRNGRLSPQWAGAQNDTFGASQLGE